MANQLPLIIGIGAVIYLLTQKKPVLSNILKEPPVENKDPNLLFFPGYEIHNCTTLIIKEKPKAYEFAYTKGKEFKKESGAAYIYDSNKTLPTFTKRLFKNCRDTLTLNSETSLFAYELYLNVYAGGIEVGCFEKPEVDKHTIPELLAYFKKRGFDTSTWKKAI